MQVEIIVFLLCLNLVIGFFYFKMVMIFTNKAVESVDASVKELDDDVTFLSEKIQKISQEFWIKKKKRDRKINKLEKQIKKMNKKLKKLKKNNTGIITTIEEVLPVLKKEVIQPVLEEVAENLVNNIENTKQPSEDVKPPLLVHTSDKIGIVTKYIKEDGLVTAYEGLNGVKNGSVVQFATGEEGLVNGNYIVVLGKGKDIETGMVINLLDKTIPNPTDETETNNVTKVQEKEEVVMVGNKKVIDGGSIISKWKSNQ